MPSRERWISKFQIKEYSWVFVPTEETIQYGQEIKKIIEDKWPKPTYFYHLKRGGHVKALQKHTRNEYFIHLDIRDFFGHINRSRVTRCLKEYFPYEKAREIAVESTVRLPVSAIKKYILPFGFVQSPIIASVCLSKSTLGLYLSKLSRQRKFKVSVYMDDIIISGNNPTALQEELEKITAAAEKSGLPLNANKQEGPSNRITAFNINMSQGALAITTAKLDEFADTYSNSTNDRQRLGILKYVFSVNPDQSAQIEHA